MIPESGRSNSEHFEECNSLISLLDSMREKVSNYKYSGKKEDLKGLETTVKVFVGNVFSSWI